jgi:serine/threonine-protein kinase 19
MAALPDASLASSFLNTAVDPSHGLTLTKAELLEAEGVGEDEIKVLLRVGCVAMRDASTFWLSFPRTGVLLKSLRAGREQITRAVRNAKFKEILQRDLLKRKFKSTGLPIRYLISDAVGRGALTVTPTTSGPWLKVAAGARD